MISYLEHNKIDKQKWDECIQQSFNGLIYAYSWYLDIICPEWDALVENDYERVFPLTHRKKSTINYLFQPFFAQQLGIFSRSILDERITEKFIESIPDKFKFIEINLNVFNKLDSSKHKVFQNKNFELDLIPSYSTLQKKYSDNIKRNLKTAGRSGLSLEQGTDHRKIVDLFRSNRGKKVDTLKDKNYQTFIALVAFLKTRNTAHTRGVTTPDGELCAGAVFVESNQRVIFIFSAVNKTARANGAMTFLLDNFIRENAERNLTLDFEGSNDINLARFYKGFGSTECHYLHYKKNNLPPLLSKSVNFIKWFRKQFDT